MTTVLFYEKPGCINNTKQKALLQAAGHELEVRNLLTVGWTVEELRAFFGDRPVVEWFNQTAPLVKSGQVVPETLDAETALQLMVKNPILIRRPLMQVGSDRVVGFETERVDAWIGLKPVSQEQQPVHQALIGRDLQTCPRSVAGA